MSDAYLPRYADQDLSSWGKDLPAILLEGPKGVGKTETASRIAKSILRCDEPETAKALQDSPDDLLGSYLKPVLIDEWHLTPEVWNAVKRGVDKGVDGLSYILTGSLPTGSTHSGAGRIVSLQLRPMTLPERGLVKPQVMVRDLLAGIKSTEGKSDLRKPDYVEAIVSSGFPGIFQKGTQARERLLDSYLERVVDKDFVEFGLKVRKPQLVMDWLRAFAGATGSVSSWNAIRDAAARGKESPARSTVEPYIDVLSRLRLLDDVEPWLPAGTPLRLLMQSPKHFLVDPALAARLVGFTAENGITNPFVGHLFENLVALSLRVFAPDASLRHLRAQNGRREVDFILERRDGKFLAIEVKFSNTIAESDSDSLNWLHEVVGDRLIDKIIINTGEFCYRTRSGVLVVPLGMLG